MRNDKENLIVTLSFNFALSIIEFAEALESQRKYVIANQILNPEHLSEQNVREAQNAESKADFIHKLKSRQKKQMKLSAFYNCASSLRLILLTRHWMISCNQ